MAHALTTLHSVRQRGVEDFPPRLHCGENALEPLAGALAKDDPVVQIVCGGGSIKKSGLYDQVRTMLENCGKTVIEDAVVMPNPTVEKCCEGARIACATMSNSFSQWAAMPSSTTPRVCPPRSRVTMTPGRSNKRDEAVTCNVIPIGAILTMVGAGSKMNGRSVITSHAQSLKLNRV